MCGLVGIAGSIGMKEEKMLRTLLILDSLRGEDSTGIAVIPKKGDVFVAKELGGPFELFASRKWERAMKTVTRAIIGHNRYATSGGVSKATAHPFDFDTLVGVHNGTLKNKHNLLDAMAFKVDSENLYHHIEQKGLKNALTLLDGAWALVWWDKLTDSLKILRNKERPLFIVMSEDNKTMFWASEQWMLQIAASREGIKLQNIIPVVEDMLYTFYINEDGALEKPKVVHSPSTYVPYVYQGNQQQTYVRGMNNSNVVKATPPPTPAADLKKTVLPIGSVDYFTGKTDISLEIVGEGKDENGNVFIQLMDYQFPAAHIRVYPHRHDRRDFAIGRELLGTFSEVVQRDDGDYFKISPHNIFFIAEGDEALSNVTLFSDDKGNKLTKKEWETKYSHCDWCFDPLFAEDHGNRLNNTGGCFCGKCVSNPEAIEYQTLKAVY